MEQTNIDLATYMSGSISRIMAKAYKNVLSNPREAKIAFRMQQLFAKSEKRRKKVQEKEGIDVPPFLISSISTTCNLHCKGCYARSNGIANDQESERKVTMTPQQWQQIFTEAADMGINFSLLAGGEPMMRKDILEAVAEVKDMIFPIFTNGTLIGPSYVEFLRKHLNMVPIISIEGTAMGTDERRGQGVFKRAMQSMELLKQEDLFFGTSITITTENYQMVTSSEFIDQLRSYGCKIVFYIEYVPTEAGTEHLAFSDEHVAEMEQVLEARREEYEDIIFLSFPGDEKALGGCLASGRGFFHIGPDGSAEPCPFSPFSDSNVAEMGVRKALQSPLFRKIRTARALGWDHTGGCTLFEHREEIEEMISPRLAVKVRCLNAQEE
ncbi:MAG: radical SAM protein [Prevotella sp.]|nr:radical SAM protein [Prevotella sp.]